VTVTGHKSPPGGGGGSWGSNYDDTRGASRDAAAAAEAQLAIQRAPLTAAPVQSAAANFSDLTEVIVTAMRLPPPIKTFAWTGTGGWSSGDNQTFRSFAQALGAEIYLAGPTIFFPMTEALKSAQEFMKENPDGHVNVMGYSAGGSVAIGFANDLHTKGIPVGSVVLFDPHPSRWLGMQRFSISGTGLEVWNFFQQNPQSVPFNTFRGGTVQGVDCTQCFIVNINMSLNSDLAVHSNIVDYALQLDRPIIEQVLHH
jgi:pimeloyl-ACP methyl ester carboxylesterase